MANIDGVWDCVTKSPMGEQKLVLTLQSSGDSFTGTDDATMGGKMEIKDGKIDGDTISWKMDMKVPMPMTLQERVEITGDTLERGIKAGAFCTSPIKGTRRA